MPTLCMGSHHAVISLQQLEKSRHFHGTSKSPLIPAEHSGENYNSWQGPMTFCSEIGTFGCRSQEPPDNVCVENSQHSILMFFWAVGQLALKHLGQGDFLLIPQENKVLPGHLSEFLCQLIAFLLVAQCLERWCASLVAPVRILAVSFRVSQYKGKNPSSFCLQPYIHDLVL